MTPEEIMSAIDSAIGAKVILTYPQLALFVLLSGAAAFIGAYLKKKGENLATHEDIERLTKEVEDIKITYSRQIEDYKAEIARRSRVAEVAEFLTHWISPTPDYVKLNGYAMTLSLWLRHDLYCKLARCICHEKGAPTPKELLIEVRRYLLKDQAGEMVADNIIHFIPPPKKEPNQSSDRTPPSGVDQL